MRELTDREIVDGLLHRDSGVARMFFHHRCRPLFLSLMKRYFDYPIEYDEFVSMVVEFLMKDNSAKLRSFRFESSIYRWLRTCLVRHFIKKRNELIENESKEPLYPVEADPVDSPSRVEAKLDIEMLLTLLSKKNERYAYTLRRLMLDDASYDDVAEELGVEKSNVYNIKSRAMDELIHMALGKK